jgi:hypothetical protein
MKLLLLDTGIFICDTLAVTSQIMIYRGNVSPRVKRVCFGVALVSSITGATLKSFKPANATLISMFLYLI